MKNTAKVAAAIVIGVVVFGFIGYRLVLRLQEEKIEWKEFSSPEGKFTVLMPQTPSHEDSTVSGMLVKSYSSTRDTTAFMCSYFDLPASTRPPDVILDAARDGSIKNMNGSLVSEEKSTLDGHPVRTYRATAKGGMVADARMHLVGSRLYLLLVVHQSETDPDTNKFLDSFKITSAP